MKVSCIVIGGGLSGLAAAIRLARFGPDILLLEQHSRLGGLNSYYYRQNILLETGLHAITNYAEPADKHAPLNRLLRQLKISRSRLVPQQQIASAICFPENRRLLFSNDFQLLNQEICRYFPQAVDAFAHLQEFLRNFNPFTPAPFRSAKAFLTETLGAPLLADMLLCPLMYYGSSIENDMDLSQFAIMFRAIYQEGLFRPQGTVRDFLKLLEEHFLALGGTLRRNARVREIITNHRQVLGVRLESGEVIEGRQLLSTIGSQETRSLLHLEPEPEPCPRLGFIESIFVLPASARDKLPDDRTVLFYNDKVPFSYSRPAALADFSSGVICLPQNFQQRELAETIEVRSTHLASYDHWLALQGVRERYDLAKDQVRAQSLEVVEKYLGKFRDHSIYEDTFTPLTIERYTAKRHGAIYGSPTKIKDGAIGYSNLFLAGTDQGFLGIIGSMLSGVSIVNQHMLTRI
ncbi:MAG: phytoene desaturase family protein [Desulfopila sp.]